jgi:hypothetical protein
MNKESMKYFWFYWFLYMIMGLTKGSLFSLEFSGATYEAVTLRIDILACSK